MLQILRKKAQSTFIQIIVVIIALVFIFWGVGTNLNNNRQAALVVNDQEISFQEFQQAYDRAYQRLNEQFGGNMPKGLAETLNIKQQVINQLVQTALLRQGAREMGIVVSSQDVREAIENMVQFQENGVFNLERYKTVLATNRMAPTKFEASMRFDHLSQVAIRQIGNFGAVATPFEMEQLYRRVSEKVAVDFAEIKPADYLAQVEVNEDELRAWFTTVQQNYQTEPKIKLRYLAFTYDDVAARVEIDEQTIETYYQENTDQFKEQEQRHARHILFTANPDDSDEVHAQKKAKAEEIRSKAVGGEDFATLAKEYSEGPSKVNGGDLGFFAAGSMVPPFDNAVFSMQENAISEVIKTRFGYHIIKLEEIRPAQTKTLAEVRDQIIAKLKEKEAETLAFQMANDAYEAIIGAGSLDIYSEQHPDSDIRTTGFITRTDAPPILRQDPKFLASGFSLGKGELSSLIKGDTGYVILFNEDTKEPEIPDFASIKDKVAADYRQAQANEKAQETAQELLDTAKAGQDFMEAAEAVGVAVNNSGLFDQSNQTGNTPFPQELQTKAFLLSAANPFPEKVEQVGTSYFVYRFAQRQIPDLPDNADELDRLRDSVLQAKKQELLAAWLRNMEIDATITKHQSL